MKKTISAFSKMDEFYNRKEKKKNRKYRTTKKKKKIGIFSNPHGFVKYLRHATLFEHLGRNIFSFTTFSRIATTKHPFFLKLGTKT